MAEFSERRIPHQAVVSVTGIVYQQMRDGSIDPFPKHSQEFILTTISSSEKECVEELEKKMEILKNSWIKEKETTQNE